MKVKKIISGLIAFTTVTSFLSFMPVLNPSAETLPANFILGDIDSDNKITVKDLLMLKQSMVETLTLNDEQLLKADLTQDGKITMVDLVMLMKTILDEPKIEILPPQFSVQSGFYDENFQLEIINSDSDLKIYYTLDGTKPTTASTEYKEEINVSDRSNEDNIYASLKGMSPYEIDLNKKVAKSTVVRAISVDKDGNTSPIVNSTYFVGENFTNKYKDYSVISLITDPENLFDYEKGIYTQGKIYDQWVQGGGDPTDENKWEFPGNYMQKGEEWERPVYIEFFDNDKKIGFSQDMGIRLQGNATRSYMQKSLKLYAREEYGKKTVKYNLIPNNLKESDTSQEINEYKRFILRNGGNDAEYTKMRDTFIQNLVSDRSFSTQASRPTITFINGEYWGVYNIREDFNDDYIKYHYDIPKDDVIMMENWYLEEGIVGEDEGYYYGLLDWIRKNDLSLAENYKQACEMIDIESLINYSCSEIYIGNKDWMNNVNNIRMWRSRSVTDKLYQDGKWRWMMYDTEMSLGLYDEGNYTQDTLKQAISSDLIVPEIGYYDDHIVILSNLMKNPDFKKKFVVTFMDLANENFKYENAVKKLDEKIAMYKPVMQEQYERFGPAWVNKWYTPEITFFDEEVGYIKKFLKNRGDFSIQMFTDNLNLSGKTANVKLNLNDIDAGKIKVNTIYPTFNDGSWSGKYFIDYPVEISASPKTGYKFIGWQGASESTEKNITVNFTEDITLTAIFEKIK